MKRILIANRGEIAVRVIRTAREVGMSPIAIFSDADQDSLHVRMADEAIYIGPPPPSESYLSIEKIISAAQVSHIDAIHPGYGFLSENAAFAKACEKAKIVFIGPPHKAIALMGDKIEARKIAAQAGLSMTPASGALKDVKEAKKEAAKIGYPVLIKAKAGGGGKGMRRVDQEANLEEAFRLAKSEAEKAFKDGTLYLEKYVLFPRHIEVQVFADSHSHVLALGDRECSIQRRHQKVLEEALAPRLSEKTRQAMWIAACKVTKAVDYVGAGTIEFLVDKNENFYFLEMNTRLQVEHPVTEWVTGLDLVAWQIDVAFGGNLPITQEQVVSRGHSMEARIYAEDTANRFFPAPGKVASVAWPSGPGIRIDSSIENGSEISLYYDPMVAKISVWGQTREQALQRLTRALAETQIVGIKTNISFLQQIIAHTRFQKGELTTTFIQEEGPFVWKDLDPDALDAALAVLGTTEQRKILSSSQRTQSLWWQSGLPKQNWKGTR